MSVSAATKLNFGINIGAAVGVDQLWGLIIKCIRIAALVNSTQRGGIC